ncbi:MAG: BatA domain-containing protein [Acidobacteria bacterium]|nr:BatA domain-containing protein [Acidobacteriota bacterium]
MISWLYPAAWMRLAALAGPIVVHLLRRQRAARLAFPSLRFVPASRTAAIRLRLPTEPLLLAVRVAIVALRLLAIAIAIGGVIDPAVSVRRSRPVRLDVRLLDESSSAHAARDQLVSHLKDDVATLNAGAADAIVLVGGRPDVSSLPAKVPVFTISLRPTTANVRIVDAASPAASRPGQDVHAIADIEATGMAGRGSVITLEHQGITLGRLEHRWTLERERFRAMLPFTPPAAGTVALRINVTTADERDGTDNATDFRVLSFSRPLKVLIFEARPSWAIAFIRRALESDPTFQIASYARASRGAEVTAGDPPASLTSGGLDAFDAVIAGAPEELGRVEVDALDRFARIRGGAVIFAPDRRPAGPYTTLIPTGDFEQILLDLPVGISRAGPAGNRCRSRHRETGIARRRSGKHSTDRDDEPLRRRGDDSTGKRAARRVERNCDHDSALARRRNGGI